MRRHRRFIGTGTAALILACGLALKSGCGVNFAHKKDVTGLFAGGLLAWLLLFQDNDLGGRTNDNGANGIGDTGAGGDATAGAPADGRDGLDGINCWDLNADGIADVDTEDTNGDGTVDVRDCRGRDGAPGADGADGIAGLLGPVGPAGPQGAQGEPGPAGPQGPEGPQGPAGTSGSNGSPGANGSNGLACWDLDGNGVPDIATEDTNGDGRVDVDDCRGGSFFDIFIDDYFGPPDGLKGRVVPLATDSFGRLSEPVLGGDAPLDNQAGSAIAYRVGIPVSYTEGNDVTMRLTFYRTGLLGDDCFKFKVDRARLRDGQDIELYSDPRYVTIDSTGGGMPRGLADLLGVNGEIPGKTLVVDLPINTGESVACDGRMDGLGFWVGDLNVADLIALELSVDLEDLGGKYADVQYHLLGVEFFEGAKGTAVVRGARIFDEEHPDPPCGDLGVDCNDNGVSDECDLANCDGSPWCSDCNQNGVIDQCDLLCGDYQVPSVSTTPVECSMDCNMDSIPDECQDLECSADSDCFDEDECTEDFCDGCACVHMDIGTEGPGIDTDDHVFVWDTQTLRVSDIATMGPIVDIGGTATTSGGFDDGHHMVFDTAGQRMFVSDHDRDFMVFDTSALQLSPNWSTLNLDEPLGIAPLPNGQLLITDEEDSGGLLRINADLTLDAATADSPFVGAEGVAYDSVHDLIFVADEDDDNIEVFNGTTLDHISSVATSCTSDGPYWLGVDGSSNRLFVLADSRCGNGGNGPVYGIHVFDIGCRPGDLSYSQTIVGSGEPGSDCFGTLAVSESTDRLFAIDYCNDTVAIIDTLTLEMLGTVPVERAGEEPLMVSVGHLNPIDIVAN